MVTIKAALWLWKRTRGNYGMRETNNGEQNADKAGISEWLVVLSG